MKKFIKIFVLLLVFLPTYALAETYKIDEGTSINFNSEWYVFTRDNYIGNKDLSALGITEDKMKSIFDTNFLYVDALNKKDFNKEFFVRKVSFPSKKDMKDYTDVELKSFGNGFVTALPTKEWDTYKNENDTYIHLNFVDEKNGKSLYMEEYVTIYNNYVYSYGLQTTDKVITESDKKFVKETVDGIKYNNQTIEPEKKEEEKKDDDIKKQENENNENNEDKKDYLVFGIIALGIICITVIIITLIIQQNRKKQN